MCPRLWLRHVQDSMAIANGTRAACQVLDVHLDIRVPVPVPVPVPLLLLLLLLLLLPAQ